MSIKYILFCITFAICSSNFAGLIEMANETIITENLVQEGFRDFAEKTHIVEQIANKKLHPLGVELLVERTIQEYNETTKNNSLKDSKPLIDCLLKNSKTLESLQS